MMATPPPDLDDDVSFSLCQGELHILIDAVEVAGVGGGCPSPVRVDKVDVTVDFWNGREPDTYQFKGGMR